LEKSSPPSPTATDVTSKIAARKAEAMDPDMCARPRQARQLIAAYIAESKRRKQGQVDTICGASMHSRDLKSLVRFGLSKETQEKTSSP